MATIFGKAYDFWRRVQEVSPRGIDDEANSLFRIALVGKPDDRARLKSKFLENATEAEREEAENHISELDEAPAPDAAGSYAFTIYVPENETEAYGARGAGSVPFTAPDATALAKAMVNQQPKLAVALGRRFPFFRPISSDKIIRDASKTNAQIALISGLPGVFPPAAIILPASSMADVLLLTKNQGMMVLRLAAVHGKLIRDWNRLKELTGVLGAALGWRTVARELSGFIPIPGVGLAIKAAIAYTGTVAAGRSAVLYYKTGRKPTVEEVKQAYKDAEQEGKEAVKELVSSPKQEAEPVPVALDASKPE